MRQLARNTPATSDHSLVASLRRVSGVGLRGVARFAPGLDYEVGPQPVGLRHESGQAPGFRFAPAPRYSKSRHSERHGYGSPRF